MPVGTELSAVPGATRVASEGVTLDGVEMTYSSRAGSVAALTSTSLEVRAGSFTAVVGPSGCGKSTLLKLVAGLLQPTGGKVQVGSSPARAGRRDIGIMFQSPVLLPWRSVMENVLLPLEVARTRSDGDRERAGELIALVGLQGFEGRYPAELSGGMQQRASLCRALITKPRLLLFDEPFGAVDALTREQLNDLVMEICLETGATAVLVTHDIEEAVYLGDEVVVMSSRPGRVVQTIAVGIPRPRDYGTRSLPAFRECTAEVRRLLVAGR
jgi:NitT/TauT family transport system ATP-binding protein